MKNYFWSIVLLGKRLLLLLIIYQLFRVAFFLVNQKYFDSIDTTQLLGGLRFDLSTIIYSNGLIILAHVVVGEFKYAWRYQRVIKIVFFVVNALCFLTTFIDFEYYKFTRVRSTFSLMTGAGMEMDVVRLLPSFIIEFWYLFVIYFLMLIAFWKVIPNAFFSSDQKSIGTRGTLTQSLIMLLFFGLSIVIGRGGFQQKPLDRIDALNYATVQNVSVVLNTPFCILRTISKRIDIVERHFYDPHTLDSIFSPVKIFNNSLPFNKKNVVIIILESFGQENIGFYNEGSGFTPFLDSLISQSRVFKNGFANGKLSIDAVPSILAGIPSLMTNSYITSTYGANSIMGFPSLVKEMNYYTSFFHGAFNGSQHFDKFASISEFDQYVGKNEYPLNDGEDGAWGIFDEEFMQFYCKEQTNFRKPFFSVLFTISSHNPYTVPKKYNGKFPHGTAAIHESIGYTDFALKEYFDAAKKQEWYKNTLFVLTADHTSSEGTGYYASEIGKYLIPIIFFDPSNPVLKGEDSRIFQHSDIMPYVLNYLGYSGKFVNYGNQVNFNEERFAINYSSGVYHFIYDDYYLQFDGEQVIGAFLWKEDRLLKNNLYDTQNITIHKAERLLKAFIQSFNNRVINNRLTP